MHAPHNLIPHFIHDRFLAGQTEGSFPAAVLFVDLAGFTRLADELARRGRSGAERLAHTLGIVFRPLVHEVYARGGFVATFAGDAFTAVFPVCRSSKSIDCALRDAVETGDCIPRRVGALCREHKLALGVRVGLAQGTVRWGIVGETPPFSFYFRGWPIDRAARAQARARIGDIVAGIGLRGRLAWVSTRKIPGSPFVRLIPPPTAAEGREEIPPPLACDALGAFVPDSIRSLTQSAEFREIVPMFLSFGSVRHHRAIAQCAAEVMSLCRRFGGRLVQIEFGDNGCLLLVLFGAPLAFERSADRAIEFLLACRACEWPSPWRAGAAFGTAWVGFLGGAERTEYAAIGDVMNVAARLAVRAPWGEAYVAESLVRRTGCALQYDKVGSVKLKGRRRHTVVRRVVEERGAAVGSEPLGAMVGRHDELARLERSVLPIFEGRFAGVTSVCGEAGVGKSRLVHELQQVLNRSHPMRVRWLVGQADDIQGSPLHPFRQVARRLFEQEADRPVADREARFRSALRRITAEIRLAGHPTAGERASELAHQESVLGALVDLRWEGSFYEDLDPKLRFENTVAAFRSLLKALSLSHPVIFLIEDIHWLDEASVGFLRRLPIGLDGFPVSLLLTSRYQDDGSPATTVTALGIVPVVTDLGALAPDAVAALTSVVLRGPLRSRLRDELVHRSGGNPLFVEQLVLHMKEEGLLAMTEDGAWDICGESLSIPGKIGEILIARLDRLQPAVREAVQLAAVLGREFDLRVLAHMLGNDGDVGERARAAVDGLVWVATSVHRYSFRHAHARRRVPDADEGRARADSPAGDRIDGSDLRGSFGRSLCRTRLPQPRSR